MVGEKAVLNVLSPTGGVAWVSVETDRILDTFTAPIQGNTSRIEIPVKPEYEPNVFVSVYVLRPGGSDQLAGEMFGYDQLAVQAPGRALDVSVKTTRAEYEPREKISGEVSVTAAGRPWLALISRSMRWTIRSSPSEAGNFRRYSQTFSRREISRS